MWGGLWQWLAASGVIFLAVLPSSTSYKINNYGFGSGGSGNTSSSSYSLNAITGEVGGQAATSSSYVLNSGHNPTQQAQEPLAPTFDNPSNYYSKLHFVVDPATNPSDTVFAIAISSDNFATTQYIQNDNTVGAVLGVEDYQTYAAWGSSTGQNVIGLRSDTTYKIKVKAWQGKFTETGYGPTATAATAPPSMSFDIDTSASDTETSPPYAIGFGDLLPGSVGDGTQKLWFDLDTNADYGANIYLSGVNSGLKSLAANHTITSLSADLDGQTEGYGAQSASATQSSGGPLNAQSPYTGGSQNVGVVNSSIRVAYATTGPITAGRASMLLKAKSGDQTPAGLDYTETLTAIAAASF